MEDQWDKIFDEQFRAAFKGAEDQLSWDSWIRLNEAMTQPAIKPRIWLMRIAASIALLIGVASSLLHMPEEVAMAEARMAERAAERRAEIALASNQEVEEPLVEASVIESTPINESEIIASVETPVVRASLETQEEAVDAAIIDAADFDKPIGEESHDLAVLSMSSFEVSAIEKNAPSIDLPKKATLVNYIDASASPKFIAEVSLGAFGVSDFEWNNSREFAPRVEGNTTMSAERGGYSSSVINQALIARVQLGYKVAPHFSVHSGVIGQYFEGVEQSNFAVTKQNEELITYYAPVVEDDNRMSVQPVTQTIINSEQSVDTGSVYFSYQSVEVPVTIRYTQSIATRWSVYAQAGVSINIQSNLSRDLYLPENNAYDAELASTSSVNQSNVAGLVGGGLAYRVGKNTYLHLEPGFKWTPDDYQTEHFSTSPNQFNVLTGLSILL